MAPIKGARAQARETITAAIIESATAQLAEVGAAGLSLRSVARDLGMVSSAVYRYFASRDELLTVLIMRAYDELGEAVESAMAGPGPAGDRWVAGALAMRAWAIDQPHRYALLYGTPVPGYAAPDTTGDPGTRVSRALVGLLAEASGSGDLDRRDPEVGLDAGVESELAELAEQLGFGGPPILLADAVAAWSQMFGFVSFEIFGQFRNVVHDTAGLFEATVRGLARRLGLVFSD